MAKIIVQRVTDDITGLEIPPEVAREVSLRLVDGDGETAWDMLDLAPETRDKLLAAIMGVLGDVPPTYKGRSRSAKPAKPVKAGKRPSTRPDRQQLAAIREWAVREGYKVAPRGRIAAEVLEAYHRSQKGGADGPDIAEWARQMRANGHDVPTWKGAAPPAEVVDWHRQCEGEVLPPPPPAPAPAPAKVTAKALRAWWRQAAERGVEGVPAHAARGKIPPEVREAYGRLGGELPPLPAA